MRGSIPRTLSGVAYGAEKNRSALGTRFRSIQSMGRQGVPALCVIGLHLLLIAGFVAAFVGHPGLEPGPSQTMVLLILPNERLPSKPLPTVRDLKIQPIAPHFESPPLSPISVPVEEVGSILNTPEPASPPFERLISEAQAGNPQLLREYCHREYLRNGERPETGTIVLMIRVEADGHVSETKIEESSGSSRLDQATQACLVEWGFFEPHQAAGGAVASWQRTHWNW